MKIHIEMNRSERNILGEIRELISKTKGRCPAYSSEKLLLNGFSLSVNKEDNENVSINASMETEKLIQLHEIVKLAAKSIESPIKALDDWSKSFGKGFHYIDGTLVPEEEKEVRLTRTYRINGEEFTLQVKASSEEEAKKKFKAIAGCILDDD